ncbi:MAG: hypothetical protein K2M75_00120 [Clostridia bacterium]|nr:hypothetical protein [Clostridia bacterium]
MNKFFCFLEIKSTAKTIPLALIATVLAAAFDWIFYIIYLITMPIQRLCVTVYKIFPNKVKYFSNQFVKTKAKDIAEVKEFTRLDFYETIEYMKKIASYDFTQKISSSELEDDFEEYYYKTVIEGFSNHNIGA